MPSPGDPLRPSITALASLLYAQGRIVRLLDAAMSAGGVIPFETYDILLLLEDAPAQRMTMSELSDRSVLTPSGITRLVDRLEKQGFVRREANEADRRSCYAVITEAGLKARDDAWPVLRDALAKHWASNLKQGEAELITGILDRFRCPEVPEACEESA